jgi:hypothetical protein
MGGDLPDPGLTPGVVLNLSVREICGTKWGKDRRHVTAKMKRVVFHEYGLTGNKDKYCRPGGCEVDHLVSRELGGADNVRNLWPQPYTPDPATGCGAHQKDRLENELHRLVCSGRMPLAEAQHDIGVDWVSAYNVHVLGRPEGKYRFCR